ncbi:unnamed protein product [Strongylus vulgaris]|uniref:Uncharacterized protein n=1 Tax=Strongylus vulgaris TaxID=40348 RepID=A0A3P7JCY5_STRVU|nr:unnamed protein product [Strongylus vulgaris]
MTSLNNESSTFETIIFCSFSQIITVSYIESIYDVVVVGADRFFSSFGALYFFDGRNVSLHESGLSSPSALAVDRQRKLIFIGSLLNEV